MTRKDTILVAVFINAALLTVLMISAIKREPKEVAYHKAPVEEALPEPVTAPVKASIKKTQGDEIDQVLKEFSQKKSQEEGKTPKKIDFAKELEAITKAAQPEKKQSATKVTGNTKTVKVKKGDSLEKIARAQQTTVGEIMRLNGLSKTVLQIDQVLKVPENGSVTVQASSGQDKYYTVKQGDNPWTIAVKNQLKVDELLRLNDLNEEKARRLRPGDQLRIR